ncbi:hypothetical protein Mapa_007775 [Marchantia paleacea]|nr:hypothetical protein Mapa_007775 [Marchantia paleacea]
MEQSSNEHRAQPTGLPRTRFVGHRALAAFRQYVLPSTSVLFTCDPALASGESGQLRLPRCF